MPQPIPKKILAKKPELALKPFNTLLVDGNNLLEVSYAGGVKLNSREENYAGVLNFFIKLKVMLKSYDFQYVYVFWDGIKSGQLRYNYYPAYKANRGKMYEDEGLCEYTKLQNEYCRRVIEHSRKKRMNRSPEQLSEEEKKDLDFKRQKGIIMACLEELFIRQYEDEKAEGDDLIGYYVKNKKENERIVIMSGDRDLTQLISPSVIIYLPVEKKFINQSNAVSILGYKSENVLLKKILCGDASDNIKGIKGLGETTLMKNFPILKEKAVDLDEILGMAKKMVTERVSEKKKPLKWQENMLNRVTDGPQGEKVYEINRKIIDLSNPLMTDEAREAMDSMMYAVIDPDGRGFDNLYKIICDNGIDDLKDDDKFSSFFIEFNFLVEKEKKRFSQQKS